MSLQVARVKGIPIKLHFTLAIVFALIAWTLAVSYMPVLYPDLPQWAYWTMGILGGIILFILVLLHELSHSMVAKRYGFRVRQIILFVFGGVSDIQDEPREDYKKEFTLAIVGPISSFALAGLFAVVWYVLIQVGVTTTATSQADILFAMPQLQREQARTSPTTTVSEEEVVGSIAQGIMRYGIIVNILLGGFNLLPAFPLDGGRVLRAGLMRWKGNYHVFPHCIRYLLLITLNPYLTNDSISKNREKISRDDLDVKAASCNCKLSYFLIMTALTRV